MKNTIIEGEIFEGNFSGKNKFTADGKNYHIKGGIEEQRVSAKVRRGNKAKLLEILERSPWEDGSPCPHLECGGCTFDAMTYKNEISYKKILLEKLFFNLPYEGAFDLVPSSVYENYRNKMEYTFGDEFLGSDLALGLHKKNRFYEIVNTKYCRICHKDFNIIREETREFFKDVPFFNRRNHSGILRHLAIRRTNFGELLINLVTVKDHNLDLKSYVQKILSLKLEAQVVGIVHTINDSEGDAIIKEGFEVLYGRDYCIEEILGLKFKISAFSFFQTNSYSAEILYRMAREMIENLEGKKVLDLYSGTGTITQIFGKAAESAFGIEIVEEAVDSARENARLNEITNVNFIAGDVLKELDNLDFIPDIIILDPPRAGVHPKALEKIIAFGADEVLYISCNPETLVRDLEVFNFRGYRIEKLKTLDQFPRTKNLEALCLLKK
ncbi:23S rRNA (uracil(1939)-C(5))-methyltransferase RlmD [uncultured Peptoniphilus sp.]|uniref:23S rRNA (uracil(1939)-C(5))-methyltransferase RlmD n=1 Tax=uncultured Peptoniphilus sp. TaxID=254354 RepID=UPI002803E543|nr:23S rRNA (uracil(1939)-C(5))-methyltransferase RlmD [uncultured Peptoniphilus sp.]